jgi:hypothetical protein
VARRKSSSVRLAVFTGRVPAMPGDFDQDEAQKLQTRKETEQGQQGGLKTDRPPPLL